LVSTCKPQPGLEIQQQAWQEHSRWEGQDEALGAEPSPYPSHHPSAPAALGRFASWRFISVKQRFFGNSHRSFRVLVTPVFQELRNKAGLTGSDALRGKRCEKSDWDLSCFDAPNDTGFRCASTAG